MTLGLPRYHQEADRKTHEKGLDCSSGIPGGAATWGRLSLSLRKAQPITDCLRVKITAKLLLFTCLARTACFRY
jgi:hypothetical protein